LKTVIFDLGNVLVTYDHRRTLEALAEVSAATVDELWTIAHEIAHALTVGDMSGVELHELLMQRAGTTRDFSRFFTAFCSGMTPDPAALDYALSLQDRPDATSAVISNTNELHVRWLDEHVPALKEFDLVMMSNEVHLAKPDPAIFLLALELLDLPPAQTLFIDDMAENVDAAQSLGMAGLVHVNWGQTRPALEAWLTGDIP
jgi:putative hydrolase of the HAD superfamily